MAWRIELSDLARKNLKQLDPQTARRILAFLIDRIASLENRRAIGEVLRGSKLGELWKYRVGDYRIISSLKTRRSALSWCASETVRMSINNVVIHAPDLQTPTI
jgi:mRNA interferase RelE/StbE